MQLLLEQIISNQSLIIRNLNKLQVEIDTIRNILDQPLEVGEWSSKKKIAEYLDTSIMTLDRLRKDGLIEWKKEGRRVFINTQSFLDYFENK